MTANDMLALVTSELTGDTVTLDVKDGVIRGFILDGVEMIRDWYLEPDKFETVPYHLSEGGSGYALISDLAHPVHLIRGVYSTTARIEVDPMAELDKDLLGLPGNIMNGAEVRVYASEISTNAMVKKLFSYQMEWEHIDDKIMVDDFYGETQTITIQYAPFPASIEDMAYGPALTWLKKYVIAKTKITWGSVLGKFQGGVSNIQTSASELRSEGEQALEKLEEKLENFHFDYSSMR